MSDYDQRQDLNALAERFQSTNDDDKAREFITMSPDRRFNYLSQLRAAARSDLITNTKRAVLWTAERKMLYLDAELRRAGR